MSVSCPYCGLPKWRKVEQVLSDTRRFLIVNLCQCENCGKMFYLCRTKISTFTVKLDDVNQEELLQETRTPRKPVQKRGEKKQKRPKENQQTTQSATQENVEKQEEKS